MKVTKELIPFLLLSIAHLVSISVGATDMANITKPLIVLSLIFYFKASVEETPINKLVVFSLAMSVFGDALLIYQHNHSLFFIAGLGAFLLAHIGYAWINFNLVNDDVRKFRLMWQDAPIILVGFLVFLLIKDGVGDLRIPVLSYIAVIAIMGVTARQRWNRVDKESFWFIMCGASMFMVSDTLLAMNKFVEPFPQSGLSIMLTYTLAQFLIVKGIIVFIQKIRPEAGS